MDNRDRDKLSRDPKSRDVSENDGRAGNDSDADFGQNIGRSERWDIEPSRRNGTMTGSNTKDSEH